MPSFEFCAFRFLTQWEESEYAFYNAIRSAPTEKDIRKALSYFQVARNFEGLKEPAAAFILQCLVDVRADQAPSSPHEKVNKLAEIFEKRFNQYNLSAASAPASRTSRRIRRKRTPKSSKHRTERLLRPMVRAQSRDRKRPPHQRRK